MLEPLARLPTEEVPRDYVALAIELPGDATVEEIAPSDLPGWDAADRVASRAFGDAWLAAARSALLRVPALAVPQERRRGNVSSAGRAGAFAGGIRAEMHAPSHHRSAVLAGEVAFGTMRASPGHVPSSQRCMTTTSASSKPRRS